MILFFIFMSSFSYFTLSFSSSSFSSYFSSSSKSYNHTNSLRSLTNKETVQIVAYNNINGYLNWHEQFFTDYISNKCNTNCLFSTNPSDVNKILPLYHYIIISLILYFFILKLFIVFIIFRFLKQMLLYF